MSSYAIISDIHGSLDELESIWARIKLLGLSNSLVLNAGDTVAYGAQSSACIDFIQKHEQIVSVGGNYDYNVADFPNQQQKFKTKWYFERPEKFNSISIASFEISETQRAWLRSLPKLLELTIEGKSIALCHYSPVGKKTGLGTWTTDEELLRVSMACTYDAVVTGHTHTPFVRKAGQTLFINPGSVGRSWGEPTFAVMSIENDVVSGEIVQ